MDANTREKIRKWIEEKKVVEIVSETDDVKNVSCVENVDDDRVSNLADTSRSSKDDSGVEKNTIILGNCIEILRGFKSNLFSAVICDPPYGLEFMGKEFDSPWKQLSGWQNGGGFSKPGIGDRKTEWPSFSATSLYGGANPTCGTCGGRARGEKKCSCETPNWKPIGKRKNPENEGLPDDVTSTGMAKQMKMFQEWNEAWAKEVLRVLKPGGHLLSFGGSRTYHRMVCGIEDAGFQIRDKMDEYCELDGYLAWVHGQGFPKSLNIGKQMEKMERGCSQGRPDPESPMHGKWKGGKSFGGGGSMWAEGDVVKSEDKELTGDAKSWEGYGTALKPSHEPIAVFGKDADPLNPDVPFKYEAKASGKERNAGCENLFWLKGDDGKDVLISKEDYDRMVAENESRKDEEGFQKHNVSQGNNHPTIKPLDLMRYLVRMCKMPGDNLILDPFMGSGTLGVACVLEGCNFVGIDMDENYIKIAQARVDYAKKHGEDGYK
jgi:site-specific DNA-methyltransferase (adenine-specific)